MSLRTLKQKKSRKSFVKLFANASVAALVTGAFMVAIVDDASAQRRRKPETEEPVEGRQFGAKAGEMVNEALQLMNSEQYAAALAPLSKALTIPDLNPYEKSTIYQMQGSAYYETNNHNAAIQAFENAISAGGLLPNEVSNLRVNIAQLLIANGQQARGAQMLEDWARSGGQLKPQHIEMLWQAWVQVEQYRRALPWAERWFRESNPKERKHYDVLNFLYNNLNMPAKQADIVLQMINRWPEDINLWNAWASMLANGGREDEAFEVSKMLYLGGAYNKQSELEKVVQYYSFYDMPYQAAEILEREMNAGRIRQTPEKLVQLSDLLRQAREYKRAIPILEKAAKMGSNSKLYADLGEALYNVERCDESEVALKKAMELGYNRGKAWMLIANCRYNKASAQPRLKCNMSKEQIESAPRSKYWKSAIEAFDNVPSTSREAKNARKWQTFIRGERQGFFDRCEFQRSVTEDRCMLLIGQAYDAVFITGTFELEDKSCMKFKPKYDKLYRQKIDVDDKKDN
ncbi:MAG TPA: tetratricopeptide repeat protein [Gammaproteobacteria bacterium]|nr:tetratricopeptide repeat protein [Gammaproteobacteria bacterium]